MPLAETWSSRYQKARSWEEATRVLMLASKALPILDEVDRTADKSVAGCESNVWMQFHLDDDSGSEFLAFSDGKIVRGLLQLISEPIQGLTREQYVSFDFDAYLTSLNLDKYLSPSRHSGVAAIVAKLKEYQHI